MDKRKLWCLEEIFGWQVLDFGERARFNTIKMLGIKRELVGDGEFCYSGLYQGICKSDNTKRLLLFLWLKSK